MMEQARAPAKHHRVQRGQLCSELAQKGDQCCVHLVRSLLVDPVASAFDQHLAPQARHGLRQLGQRGFAHRAANDRVARSRDEQRRLTNERGQTWVRSWSPDGKKIAASVFREGRWGLRWIDASSGATGVITAPSGPNTYVRYPEWSPQGDLVVYERGELRGNVWMLRLNAPRPVQTIATETRRAQP